MWIFRLCLSTLLMVHVVQSYSYNKERRDDLSTDDPAVQKDIIDRINNFRRQVQPTASNMLEVSWNKDAAKTAAEYAKKCEFEHSKVSARNISDDFDCGENLYMTTDSNTSWEEALTAFFIEHIDYHFENNSAINNNMVGHYTQIVWYVSRMVGCAYFQCTKKHKYQHYFVCHHCPAGNVVGLRPYKNGTSCGDCPKNCNDGLCTNPCTNYNKYGNCDGLKDYCSWADNVKKGCKASCRCTTEIY